MTRLLSAPFDSGLIVENPHKSLDDYLRNIGMTPHRLNEVPDEASLIDAINSAKAQVLFKRSRVPVTREVVENCPTLHSVQLCCIGDDSVDKIACAKNGVLVFNDPFSNARSVVELAIAHMIAMSRRLYETDVQMHVSKWAKTSSGRYEIAGKRLGIVGLGNIGRQVARAAEAHGMEIAFYDNRPVAVEVGVEMGFTACPDLATLFRTSDIVTVHTSAKDFFGNLNDDFLDGVLGELSAERENSPRLFLNLARGNVHSVEALRAAVDSGAIRRAAVDVYPSEPRPGEDDVWKNPYADEPRVICTPHIGAATQEAQPRIARRVATTVEGFSHVGSLRDCVYGPREKVSLRSLARGNTVLAVVHSTARGTKKAVDDAIYEADANNIASAHRDFEIGVAYDLSILDRPLRDAEIERLIAHAAQLSGESDAIRAVRQFKVPSAGF